ncbi:hypothetical protein Aph01nite_20480 [Acrocarpospora phusangensis]|uniref:DUF3180 domain-containing protein n=1 Tax=Acrocarpospora phusangensis TaxID=1070424 RepID=A0A919Q844_9ACTN|nr:DUF3180 domain-containing protein [Acrocarpospora phusangensis]GIH23738.1 hypothetical protein Aph01nite_20480 [Acrocarpospora phusangensis]
MKPSNPGVLVGLVVVFAILTWGMLKPVYHTIPALPWTAIPTLLLLAIGEAYTGWLTRARIARREGTKPVEPLAVARLAALAKATAYAGSVFAGVFGGFIIHTVEMIDVPDPRQDAFIAGGSFISCVLLICAALYLEFSCRVPDKTKRDDD